MLYEAVVAAAAAQGASALGYRMGHDGRVIVNPPKSTNVFLGPTDEVLVVGNRET
jgi:hypothetical protein